MGLVFAGACGSSGDDADAPAGGHGAVSGSGHGGAGRGGNAGTGGNAAGTGGHAGTTRGGAAGAGGGAGTRAAGAGGSGPAAAGEDGNAGTPAVGAGADGGGAAIDCRRDGDGKTTLVFVNGCSAALSFRGSDISGGTLAPGGFACVDIGSDVEPLSAKRYWGFLGEDPGAEHHTLAEFTFNTDFNDFDWYNISHVDAFNLPLQIVPVAREKCQTLTCAMDFLPDCPEVGKLAGAGGDIIACVSPERNDGQSEVARYFEQCDDAYAWSGDDQNGDDPSPVRACAGEDWDIVFCPGSP